MATYDVDMAKTRMGELVDRAVSGEKITVSSAAGNVVIIAEEDWDSMVEALSVMMLPEVVDRMRAKYAQLSAEA